MRNLPFMPKKPLDVDLLASLGMGTISTSHIIAHLGGDLNYGRAYADGKSQRVHPKRPVEMALIFES